MEHVETEVGYYVSAALEKLFEIVKDNNKRHISVDLGDNFSNYSLDYLSYGESEKLYVVIMTHVDGHVECDVVIGSINLKKFDKVDLANVIAEAIQNYRV